MPRTSARHWPRAPTRRRVRPAASGHRHEHRAFLVRRREGVSTMSLLKSSVTMPSRDPSVEVPCVVATACHSAVDILLHALRSHACGANSSFNCEVLPMDAKNDAWISRVMACRSRSPCPAGSFTFSAGSGFSMILMPSTEGLRDRGADRVDLRREVARVRVDLERFGEEPDEGVRGRRLDDDDDAVGRVAEGRARLAADLESACNASLRMD